jgi:outer membrane protein TolC
MQEKTNSILNRKPEFRSKSPGKSCSQFLLISIYFILFPSVSLYSQTDSLLRYLEIAAENNPTVLQRFTEYEAALKKIPQAGTLPDPQLDIGVFITPMELAGGNQVADLRLMQMFPWFGVLKNARDEMSLMANAKFELFRDSKLQVYYDVQKTWYELFRVRKEIGISEKNIEILNVIEKLALIKYKAPATGGSGPVAIQPGMQTQTNSGVSSNAGSGMQGMEGNLTGETFALSLQSSGSMQSGSMSSSTDGSGLTDLYRIQIEAGDLNNSLANLRNQEKTIIARFNSYLNRPPLAEVYTGDVLLTDTLELNLSLVSDSIQKNNPMLNMLNYEKEAFQARKKMVTGMGYPMVGIGLNYSVIGKSDMSTSSMNGNDMIMPMVAVTLPIYRKKYAAMREEADLLSQASSHNYQATSNSLSTEYYSAIQLYQDAQRRIKLYKDQYLLASGSLEIMMKSFSASAVSLTDVLRVRQMSLDYEFKQVDAIADLNTAKALLVRLMANSENL